MMTMLLLAVMGSVWAGESEVYKFTFTKQSNVSNYTSTYDVTIGSKSWTIPGNLTNGDYLRIGGKSISEVNRVIQCNDALTGNISKIVFNHNGKSRANITVHSITVTVASDAAFANVVDNVTVSNPTVGKNTVGEVDFVPTSGIEWSGDLYYRFTVKISNPDTSNGGLDLTSLVFFEASAGAVDPSVSFANESETIEVGQTVTNTLTKPNDLTVTFSSEDEDVATVDEDGAVTGVAEGETTITASWNAVTDTYNAGSVSYNVTVNAASPATNFVKVTDMNQIVAGNEYILVGTRAGKAAAMGAKTGTNTYRNEVLVTVADDKVAVKENDGIAVLTLGGSAGAWTFLASDNNEYIALTANSNALHSSTDATLETSQWIITDDFQLENASFTNRYIQYNSGSIRFACYTAGNQGLSTLYVKEGSAIDNRVDPNFAFSPTEVEAEVGGSFTAPTLSYAEGFDGIETIVYASSNTEVATVDANTGVVTIVGAGTTTITASSDATDNFKKGSAFYTLTVVAPSHNVTFSANGTTFSTTTAREGATIVFPAENPDDVCEYKFIGWSTEDWTGEVDVRPATLVTSATMGTEDMTIYAVYAIATEGTGVRWKKLSVSEVTEEGIYAIITSTEGDNAYYAFNGTIQNGHGQTTPSYFVFDVDGYADNAPEGTCELIFEASGDGFLMHTEDLTANGNKPYLCANDASSGNLVWLNYNSAVNNWANLGGNWTFSKDFNGKKAMLRQYNKTLRTYAYGTSTGRPIEFAQKVGGITYSNYCTTIGKYEIVDFATDGYKTYVTLNPIDWTATLERNNGEKNIDVHGYKAIRFSEADGVSLVEFGVENQGSVSETDPMYQEAITPAGTPLVIMGKQGVNALVISSVTPANDPVGNLFHAGDGNATTTLKDNGEIDVALYVLQKIDINGSGIDNYKFYRLKPGRTVPVGKAYLSSEEITLDPQTPPVVNNSKSSFPMRVLEQNEEQLVSEDAGIVDGIGMNYQEKKDNVYYNVNGMRIANPSKGIYIVNGLKVVIK